MEEYWSWLEGSFGGNVRAQQWYNGDAPRNLSGFINDRCNRLIGWASMRQLRIKPHSCRIQKSMEHLLSDCNDDYSYSNEEKQSFVPGWINQTTQTPNSSIERAFVYRLSEELDSDGYVYEFRGRLSDIQSNISALHRWRWIDSRTRAVIVQLSLYNPNSQLFTSVSLLAEFLSTGGIQTQSRFEPISFQGISSFSSKH